MQEKNLRTAVGRKEKGVISDPGSEFILLLPGGVLNRTYVTYKNLYISLFLITIFGPTYYGPP